MAVRSLVAVVFCLSLVGACGARQDRELSRTKLDPDKVRDGELRAPRGPEYPARPGMEALQQAALGCYNQGLRHNPVFAKGGVIVIRWAADRGGDLLRMEFSEDSFRGWAIDDQDHTMADCITRAARGAKVLWSRSGSAPMRFKPAAEDAPASAPSSASQPTR
jgi:hypothetical protein